MATTGARSGSSGVPQVAQARIELGRGALTSVHTSARPPGIVKEPVGRVAVGDLR